MKVLAGSEAMRARDGARAAVPGHRGPMEPPVPPHERRARLYVEFEESDWGALLEAFGDEDTAAAAAEIIREAPPEIQILSVQLLRMIEEVNGR